MLSVLQTDAGTAGLRMDMSGRRECGGGGGGGGGVGVSLETQLESLSLTSSTWNTAPSTPLHPGSGHTGHHGVAPLAVPNALPSSHPNASGNQQDSLGDPGLGVKMAEYVLGEWVANSNGSQISTTAAMPSNTATSHDSELSNSSGSSSGGGGISRSNSLNSSGCSPSSSGCSTAVPSEQGVVVHLESHNNAHIGHPHSLTNSAHHHHHHHYNHQQQQLFHHHSSNHHHDFVTMNNSGGGASSSSDLSPTHPPQPPSSYHHHQQQQQQQQHQQLHHHGVVAAAAAAAAAVVATSHRPSHPHHQASAIDNNSSSPSSCTSPSISSVASPSTPLSLSGSGSALVQLASTPGGSKDYYRTPPKDCPLSLQTDEFSLASAIQQAANQCAVANGQTSQHSNYLYGEGHPNGRQGTATPVGGQSMTHTPQGPPGPPGPPGGAGQQGTGPMQNAYIANILSNYFATMTPPPPHPHGPPHHANGMHTPPYSMYPPPHGNYLPPPPDSPMRFGWAPPSTMPQQQNNFYDMRSRGPGMSPGMAGAGGMGGVSGWPSPGSRLTSPKVSVTKKKNETKLIKEFKSNRYPDLELRDLCGHVIEFAQDQQGSRFIQHKLESATPTEKQMIFNEIFTWVYSLMTHEFGNYVVQKLFDFGSEEQKLALAGKMTGHIVNLTMHIYGCRVMQKALVSLPPEIRKKLIDELRGHVVHCANDENGNHVMQKCFETIEPGYLQFIVDECIGKVRQLCSHSYACRVIQRLLEYCKFEQSIPILQEIHGNTLDLAQDQYGNYVIQYILQHGLPKDKSAIIQAIRGNVVALSCHKYASNVMEKCVTHGSSLERTVLMEEVCATKDGIFKMMKDPFANYVVQRMVEVADAHYSKLLVQKIALNKEQLQKSTSGKHALAKLEKYLYKYLSGNQTGSPPHSHHPQQPQPAQ
ncbi:pumilio homolog 1-like isoform X4 [Varroa destructor]|uniref:PUM-HD domain-containing protein n=1 Tax=Varroa destructor TaxID=109461 RepID=A0A7M7M378_VARDE|nr:pumilio homolog 1-like isoform X4 [Varroa destructor]